MKTPTQYGSENEETSFIRRIAAPDRAHGNRKQKKRMAVVGATVGLIAASAMVGYAAMNQGASSESAIPAENMEAQYVSNPDGPTSHPTLTQLDTNNNGQLEQGEFFTYLQNKLNSDVDKINAAALPEDVKQTLVDRLSDNFESDITCAQKAFAANKKSKIKLTEKNLKTFFNGLDEFCPTSSVDVTDELLNKYTTAPPTQPPIVETEAPFVETSAPFVEEQETHPSTTWDEPPSEPQPPVEWNTPSTEAPVVVAEEKKEDVIEHAAEEGNPAAVVEVEHHEDAVQQAAEAGNPAAVVEEEHHEAEVEQAAEEGNPAAVEEEHHHEEQVEEATADAPAPVKEEEQAVDETEEAAESGDQAAIEEVEQKQDELVQEAEEGNAEAVQEEEHIEAEVEQAAQEGNTAAQAEEDHHEEEVQQSEETTTTTTEEDNTPANDVEVVEEEQKEENVEQAAESGDQAAVVEEEQHEDAVEQAAESGDAAAVAEEEHHEAEVEQAAEEGNPAAVEEEHHHEEQVEEATADAPAPVKEEEQAVDETEQAAESGDQAAIEEVEQKQDELVQEAEEGNPEAVQEEEHIEAEVEQAAQEGNTAAQAEEEHHEAEVAVADETVSADAPWTPSDPTYPPAAEEETSVESIEEKPLEQEQDNVAEIEQAIDEHKPSEGEVVTNNSNELKDELMNAFGVGSDSSAQKPIPEDAAPAYETIEDPEVVMPSPPVDIGATSTLAEELKEELTQAVETGAEDNTDQYKDPPTVDSQDLDAMANNLLEQVYTNDGNGQVGNWNWLDPSTVTYELVKDSHQDVVSAENVFHHLMQQHSQKTTALMTELLRQAITFNMTLTCFSAGLSTVQKDQLTKEEYFQVVQWMNDKCHGEVAGEQAPQGSKEYMTKGEFKSRIAMQFEPTLSSYYASVLGVKAEHDKVMSLRQSINECLDKATENSVDPESGLVHASQFNAATMWILNVCVGN